MTDATRRLAWCKVLRKIAVALEGLRVAMIVCSPPSVRDASSALCAGRAYAVSA